jgi:hypothetical protein
MREADFFRRMAQAGSRSRGALSQVVRSFRAAPEAAAT